MRLPKVVPHAELCKDLDHDGDILSILLTQALAKSLACHKAALQFIQLRNGFLGLVVGGLAQLCHLDTAVFRCVFHMIQGHVVMHATDCTVHERQNATRPQSTRTSTVGCMRPAWKQRLMPCAVPYGAFHPLPVTRDTLSALRLALYERRLVNPLPPHWELAGQSSHCTLAQSAS